MNFAGKSVDELRLLRAYPGMGEYAIAQIDAAIAAAEGGVVRRSPAEVITGALPAGGVRIILPWSCLSSDNNNVGITGEKAKRDAFRIAKARAREKAMEQFPGPPTSEQVRVVGAIWVPDNRVRDLNWDKALVDSAVKGVVVTDDRWQVIRDKRFYVAGIDCDAPRAELLIEAVTPALYDSLCR